MSEPMPAVNAIGSFTTTTGIAEAARRAVRALVHAGVRVAVDDRYNGAPEGRSLDPELDVVTGCRPYPIDLCFLNINEDIVALAGAPGRSTYTVGVWWWELPTVPAEFAARFDLVDEVWAGSSFTAQVFASYTNRPVTVMPQVVEPPNATAVRRESIGLAEDSFVFLFTFDVHSTFARKNPLGVIEAFRRAFPASDRRDRVRLVIKALNLRPGVPAHSSFLEMLDEVNGTLITDDLSHDDMAALLAGCDAYISLHRAEGFGLGMAEAMYFGRPVIATAYSGNMNFTTDRTACLVGYRPIRVADTDWRLDWAPGAYTDTTAIWADPDLDQAAAWMRLLVDDREFRHRIGEAGRDAVRSHYNETVVGRMMAARLAAIGTSIGAPR